MSIHFGSSSIKGISFLPSDAEILHQQLDSFRKWSRIMHPLANSIYIIFSFLEHKKGSKKDVHTGNLGSGSNLRKLLMQMLRQLLLFTLEFPEKPGRLWNSGICSSKFQVASCYPIRSPTKFLSPYHAASAMPVGCQPTEPSIFQSPDVRLDPWHFLRPVQSLCRR